MPGAEAALNSASVENTLRRQRTQAGKQTGATQDSSPIKSGTINQALNIARNQENLKNGLAENGAVKTASEAAATGLQLASAWSLTVFWGSVWLDWTLLSLLYLNIHMFASLLLPKYICQLGEDYLIGKWLPEKNLAKIFEILVIVVLDVLVVSVIASVIYFVYSLIYDRSWTDYLWAGFKGATAIIPGGQTPLEAATESIFNSATQ